MGIQLTNVADGEVKEVAPGMAVEWAEQGRIVIFRMGNSEKANIDKLYDAIVSIMDQWSLDRPYLAIYEIPDTQTLFTAYVRQKISEINDHRTELAGRSAGVVAGGAASHAIRLFMMARAKKGARQKKYFATRSEALEWLKEGLQPG